MVFCCRELQQQPEERCRVGLDKALSHKSSCNQDKKDKYAHQKGASTLNLRARENHPLQPEDPLLLFPAAVAVAAAAVSPAAAVAVRAAAVQQLAAS